MAELISEKDKKLFQITTDRMFTALESFFVWREMSKMININEVGKDKADRNVEILKKYWDFFDAVKNSTYKSFVIDLSIFFDPEKYEETFSLKKLINIVKKKIIEAEYNKLIRDINAIKKKHGVTISFILKLRNTEVSHQEIERQRRLIVFKEIEELFIGVQEILNILNKYYDGSFMIWDHIERNVMGSLSWVIDNLERGEKVRLDEIKKTYV